MSGDDRNEICSCGSINPKTGMPLKKKNCFNKPEPENICSHFLDSRKTQYIQLIQNYLDSIVNEVNITLQATINDNNTTRTKTICVCSMLDVFANFWKIFINLRNPDDYSQTASDTYAWKVWFDNFIKNEQNNEWQKWKSKYPTVSINGADFYKLRSGLSHFFGIHGVPFALITNGDLGKYEELSNAGIAVLNPQLFFLFVSIGGTLMIDAINQEISSDSGLIKLKQLYLYINEHGVAMVPINS